jgi:hypothetical protein
VAGKLRKAEAARKLAEDELRDFEERCRKEREIRCKKLHDASERVRMRQGQLDDVKRQVAMSHPSLASSSLDLAPAKQACGALDAQIAPALLSFAEQLPESSRAAFRDQIVRLQDVSLALSSTFLEHAASSCAPQRPQPQRYRLAEGDESLPSLSGEETVPEPADRLGASAAGDTAMCVTSDDDAGAADAPTARRTRRRYAAPVPPQPAAPVAQDPLLADSAEALAASAAEAARRAKEEDASERARLLAQSQADQLHALAERDRVSAMARSILKQATDNGLQVPSGFNSFSEEQLSQWSRQFLA